MLSEDALTPNKSHLMGGETGGTRCAALHCAEPMKAPLRNAVCVSHARCVRGEGIVMRVVHPPRLCRAPHKHPELPRVKDAGSVLCSGGGSRGSTCARVCERLSPGIDRPLSLLEHNKGTIDCPGATELLAH